MYYHQSISYADSHNLTEPCQVILNTHSFPGRRDASHVLQRLSSCPKVVIHYDYTYIISRFHFFTESVKYAILYELKSIYDSNKGNLAGIVMHTDYPISKLAITDETYYDSKRIFDSSVINSSIKNEEDPLLLSLNDFYHLFKKVVGVPSAPILLENTTKVGPNLEGSFKYLLSYITYTDTSDVYGICFDTEHHFAVFNEFIVPEIPYNHIIHLNTIPPEVNNGNRKDRHSDTSIFDCSVNKDYKFYLDTFESLKARGILSFREVHFDVQQQERLRLAELKSL